MVLQGIPSPEKKKKYDSCVGILYFGEYCALAPMVSENMNLKTILGPGDGSAKVASVRSTFKMDSFNVLLNIRVQSIFLSAYFASPDLVNPFHHGVNLFVQLCCSVTKSYFRSDLTIFN